MMAQNWASQALSQARPEVYWSDSLDAPAKTAPLRGNHLADLTIIGGGFTGLWAAIQALEDQPGLKVVVLEAERLGFGASSRNGGFCDSSLTHGLHNGLSHWPNETDTLIRLGRENLDGIEATIHKYNIKSDFRRTAELSVATATWQLDDLAEAVEAHEYVGDSVQLLDETQVQKRVNSPTYIGGLVRRNDMALLDPARTVWGLRAAAESLGASVYEHSLVTSVEHGGSNLVVKTHRGSVQSPRVLVATNAYRAPLRRPRRYVIPVYDHVLMTEPLTTEQMASVRWNDRDGVGDAANQFHYYRLTHDNRILWGGYDAVYHFNNGLGPQHDQNDGTHHLLANHFFETFPQLEGLSFSHRWGGPIATTTQFTATWGTSHKGQLAWVAGYTGLGVGASRFGAGVALDLVFGNETERTELEMVQKKPFPFPPEPVRWAGVQVTRKAIQRADAKQGKRGMWLKLLDRFGVGFDS